MCVPSGAFVAMISLLGRSAARTAGRTCPEPGGLARCEGISIVKSWNRQREEEEHLESVITALDLLVQRGWYVPSTVLYIVLKGCIEKGDLVVGRRVHDLAQIGGHGSNAFLSNHFIRMYASHGLLEEARQAVKLYRQAQQQSTLKPDSHLFVAALKGCASAADLTAGKQIHADILTSSVEANVFMGNALVDMYAKCGSLEDARRVFDKLPLKDVVTWNAMIGGYAQHGLGHEALALCTSMQLEGITQSSRITFICLLKACASIGALHRGKELHSQIQEQGLEADIVVGNSLIDMYAKCGSLEDARTVFVGLCSKDVGTWNAMLAAYVQHGLGEEALTLCEAMQQEGTAKKNEVTLMCLLKACALVGDLYQGKRLHREIQDKGLEANASIGSSLVDMYSKCGSIDDAHQVFAALPVKDVVTWNAMLAGYVRHGLGKKGLALYASMQQAGITRPDDVTLVCLLKACASVGALSEGKKLHSLIRESRVECDVVVGSSLIDMYAKCGSVEEARDVFDRLPCKDVVTWTALITAYTEQGHCQEALTLYGSMEQEGIIPASPTLFVCLLKACARIGAIHQGKKLHSRIRERGLEADIVIANCLMDMYAKCGRLEDAREVLDGLPTRDVVTWTALLNGYSLHSNSQMAFQCFREMQQDGVIPDAAAFTSLLVACCHSGLVQEGKQLFKQMVEVYSITPSVHHFTCMVDLLGRSGYLDEAATMLQTMPLEPGAVGWTSLLCACQSHNNVDLANRCFDQLVRLQPQNSAAYVMLANIYAHAGRWKDVDRIEGLRKSAGACKEPARAWIEVSNAVHMFCVGEERADVSYKLRSVRVRLEADSHVPCEGTEESHGDALCGHAEKLALAYGLLNTPNGTTLLVTKNLRMCNDCHSGTKRLSRIEKREIIVRDAHRVHHFVNGFCSCGDLR